MNPSKKFWNDPQLRELIRKKQATFRRTVTPRPPQLQQPDDALHQEADVQQSPKSGNIKPPRAAAPCF